MMATYWLSSARCRRARAPQGSTNGVAGPQSNPAPALALAPVQANKWVPTTWRRVFSAPPSANRQHPLW
jgi:hypothetical protein